MEDVLEVYSRPYDPKIPVHCMDKSSIQLIGKVQDLILVARGHPELMDDEYIQNGVASMFLEAEPLGGKRQVKITDRRTRGAWAEFIKEILEECYPSAEKVVFLHKRLGYWQSDLK